MNMLRKRRTKHKKSRSSEVFLFQSSVKSALAHTGVIFLETFSPAGTIETQTLSYFHKAQWHHPPGNPRSGKTKTGLKIPLKFSLKMVKRNNSAASLLFLDDLKISSNPEVVFQFLPILFPCRTIRMLRSAEILFYHLREVSFI